MTSGQDQTEIFTARQTDSGGDFWGAAYGIGIDGQPREGDWPSYMLTHIVYAFPALVSGPPFVPEHEPNSTVFVASDYAPTSESSPVPPAGGFLHALHGDGTYRPGWPVQIGDTSLFSGPAVARDGSVYVTSGFYNSGDSYFATQAFTRDGEIKAGWPYRFPRGYDAWTTGPSIARDGTVYAAATISPAPDLSEDRSLLYAFTRSGEVKPGWPVEIEGRMIGAPAVAANGRTYVSVQKTGASGEPTVAYVYAFAADGTPARNWPVSLPPILFCCDPYLLTGSIRGIAVDGAGNVFFGRGDQFFGYDRRAQPLPGWPVPVPGGGFWDIWGPAIAADGTIYFLTGAAGGPISTAKIYALRAGMPPPGGRAAAQERKRAAKARIAASAPRKGRRVRPRAVRSKPSPALRMPTYPAGKKGRHRR